MRRRPRVAILVVARPRSEITPTTDGTRPMCAHVWSALSLSDDRSDPSSNEPGRERATDGTVTLGQLDGNQERRADAASAIQPAMNATPPKGVTAPKARTPVSASA